MNVVVRLIFTCVFALECCWASRRIVGGRRAKAGEFPYQLSLRYEGTHLCGAALIDEETAITAAHCFPKTGVYSVQAGSIYLSKGGVSSRVRMAITHPYHSSLNEEYDIAVLKLTPPFNYSATIQPVRLPRFREPIKEGQIGNVSGWGSLSIAFPDAVDQLRTVQLPVLDQNYCQRRYNMVKLTDNMFCAGYREGGKDSCQGDSGGPYVIDGVLYGMVSWGFNCAQPGYPGIYTNVPMLRDFIKVNSGL
ncbi:unnamed protein product [Psylliodes chrysocephalus]|uniref:Peptidase S1 domain-containing protein n=1 Tax=Psylliodes chrysocephalus TaxID=3402493 RepID=A0A9P0D0K6_9CUCU|nr:unnamed protein product [Psylliodes chrysocephala]